MAILSNVNGKFAVDSTGAIQFSGSAGTSGYILRSNGNAAPTWVDSSTVIGGPYLPLTGGTLSGALAGTTATFSGILTAQSSSSGDYVRIYGSSGTGKWDIYGNGANLRISDNESAGILVVDTGATFGDSLLVNVNANNKGIQLANSFALDNASTFLYLAGKNTAGTFKTGQLELLHDGSLNLRSGGSGTTTSYGTTALTLDSSQNATFTGSITGTTASFTRLDINASNTKLKGDLLGNVDAAYDIGASGANRPRNLFLSNSITAGDITTTGVGTFGGIVTGQVNSNTFGSASASGRALIVQSGSSNQAIMLKNNLGGDGTISVTGTATSMNYEFGTYSVAPALVIKDNGNVGIGTVSPDLGAIAGTRVLTIASPTAERWGILELAGNRTYGGNQVGELKFISTDSTNNGTLVSLTAINDPSATGTGGSLKFSTRPNGGSLTERMSITSAGYVYLGQGFSATNHRINRASTQGSVVLVVSGYGGSGIGADTAIFQATATGGANAANAGLKIEKNSSTNRSINAAGTINASGSDYAEYMEKKSTAFEIAAGDICGVNENGKLTNKFTEAHSFVVKSTDPSYVGGDTWGNSVGKKPYLTTQGPVETDAEYAARTAQYETDLANFEVALEAQRIKYDRIAFSGQVPVNITGASVGDYIIPILKEGNLITGETVTSPSFEQYQIAIGKVWKILEDGRAFISVKIV